MELDRCDNGGGGGGGDDSIGEGDSYRDNGGCGEREGAGEEVCCGCEEGLEEEGGGQGTMRHRRRPEASKDSGGARRNGSNR